MPTSKSRTKSKNKQSKAPLFMGLGLLAILVGSYFVFPRFHEGVNEAFTIITSEDQDRIQQWVKHFGLLGPLVLIFAMTIQMFMLIVPNLLLFIIAIICYGPVWGSLICMAGVFTSSSLGYFIGKKLG